MSLYVLFVSCLQLFIFKKIAFSPCLALFSLLHSACLYLIDLMKLVCTSKELQASRHTYTSGTGEPFTVIHRLVGNEPVLSAWVKVLTTFGYPWQVGSRFCFTSCLYDRFPRSRVSSVFLS